MGTLQVTATPRHQPPCGVCREGAGRQGQRGKAGPQLSEGWSSPVNLGNSSQRGMLFREGYHTCAHTQPHQRAVQHLAAIPAHGSRGKALIPKGLSECHTPPLAVQVTDSVTPPCHTARWAGRCCLQLTLPRGTAKGQSRDWRHCGVGHSDPNPRLDTPCSSQVPAHLYSSAHGRWCWGGRWGLPPGCSGRCSHHPHPGRSSARQPPLWGEGTRL